MNGSVFVWIPIDEIMAGNDGILGNLDDGERYLEATLTGFDPDDAFGVTNNYGSGLGGIETLSDNTSGFNAQAGSTPSLEAHFREPGNWGVIPTATYHETGDAGALVGQQLDMFISSGTNQGVDPVSGVIQAGFFDNSAFKIVPSAGPASYRPGGGIWASAGLAVPDT